MNADAQHVVVLAHAVANQLLALEYMAFTHEFSGVSTMPSGNC
jgi:hypothetical protein